MKRKYRIILEIIIAILLVVSLIFNYAGDYYLGAKQDSVNYLIFATTFYTASHLFCDENYSCAYSNISFPEFQERELQKYQEQVDGTSKKSNEWFSKSNILLWWVLILYLILLFSEKDNDKI